LFIVVLVPHLIPGEGGMSPPSVEEEAEEEGENGPSIEVMSMDVEHAVSLERSCSSPESAVGG